MIALTLEKAISIASEAHSGQVDKNGEPYILHPIRVMLRLSKLDDRIVAVLHDVLEDTVVTKDDLIKAGASKEIITALELVTKGDIPYEYYLHCIGMNDIARSVKRADIADNTDPERLDKLPNDVKERLIEKYSKALRILDKTEKLLQLTLKASDIGVIDLEPDYELGIEKQLDRDIKILEGFLGGMKS